MNIYCIANLQTSKLSNNNEHHPKEPEDFLSMVLLKGVELEID